MQISSESFLHPHHIKVDKTLLEEQSVNASTFRIIYCSQFSLTALLIQRTTSSHTNTYFNCSGCSIFQDVLKRFPYGHILSQSSSVAPRVRNFIIPINQISSTMLDEPLFSYTPGTRFQLFQRSTQTVPFCKRRR